MDEVDIENADDLNELEARLYSQIHHEAPEEAPVQFVNASIDQEEIPTRTGKKRYWTDGQMVGINTPQQQLQQQQQQQQNTKYRVRNQNKASTVQLTITTNEVVVDGQTISVGSCLKSSGEDNRSLLSAENDSNKQESSKNEKEGRPKTPLEIAAAAFVKPNHFVQNKLNTKKPGARRVKNPFVFKDKSSNALNPNPKDGPFFKQKLKLQKAKRLENKKQKSKKSFAKTSGAAIDFVNLISSDEDSDGSDVILIPVPPPPTYSLDDSEDENQQSTSTADNTVLIEEENALDSTDVQMSNSASFIKPQLTSAHILGIVSGSEDKRVENSSRCTSPCSIQSSDDFIGQTDRSRLLQQHGSGMADDEDLVLLTSDVNSLLEAPQSSSHRNNGETTVSPDTSAENVDAQRNEQFTAPSTTSASSPQINYRVEGQFRAVDVYESESDITDSVYSKGAPKTTVIRQIDTSSEEVEDIASCSNSSRTKRLRKRRRSSSNKSSDPNNETKNSSSVGDHSAEENDSDTNSGAERTGIPFISRGPAVEKKVRKRNRAFSTSAEKSSSRKSEHMSDGDFIAKLNNLVQVQDSEENDDSDEEINNAPSAREIAEKVLGEKREEKPKETAVPQIVCNELSEVFNTIDHMEDANKEDSSKTLDDPKINEQRTNLVYRSLPQDDNVQILEFVDDSTPSSSSASFVKKRASNGSPIYNIVYSRGKKLVEGLGWNDEMRKFYQDSWNGEDFVLSDVWRNMNPDRNLWKISNDDRYSKPNKRNNLKCTNCCEFGHARFMCKRPMKPIICYMCGEGGHQEPRCPNTLCLRCGNRTQVFVKGCNACSFQNRLTCPICKIRGHSIDHCPDKWRRYHSTTEPNAFPNSKIVYNPRKFCSICASRGHLSDSCRYAASFMEYPVFATTIKSHQKSYSDVTIKTPFGGIGVNLMYEPCLKYSFDMSDRTSSAKYYGRFLNAVGMGFLMSRKRKRTSPQSTTAEESSSRKIKKSKKKNDFSEISNAPNQVPEITESNCGENESPLELELELEPASSTSTEVVECNILDGDIQMNVVNTAANFKSPNKVLPSNNPPQLMDSDSNYSFSEHFDDNVAALTTNSNVSSENANENTTKKSTFFSRLVSKEKPKSREMETLPEFIPLVDSTKEIEKEIKQSTTDYREGRSVRIGISKRFVAAVSDDEANEFDKQNYPIAEGYPCEAKIYLSQLHSKFLLSPDGRNFLTKAAKNCQVKAHLDFTSVGHVLVIFGLPGNQDKFQRELLMKYREIADHLNTQQTQSMQNVPKRTDVLIRFLRDDINQLLGSLGNVNQLYRRLQIVERQQSKSGLKAADKIRRLLNMILVGQAGLLEGNLHLDKIMAGLKTLINDYGPADMAPLSLRSEITAHWKVIFSSYRHNNYQELVKTYNNLISKNRMQKLIIDPLLLGNKVLDTSFTNEQKEKLEQAPQPPTVNAASSEQTIQSNSKQSKRKPSLGSNNSPISPLLAGKGKIGNVLTPTPTKPPPSLQATITINNSTTIETSIKNKTTANSSPSTSNNVVKNQQAIIIPPPPPFITLEKRSTISSDISAISEKCKTTCDTLLTKITEKNSVKGKNRTCNSKHSSPLWSQKSIRYLNECVEIVESRPDLMEKIKRVQHKSKNGKLSYNDYLAVIKLHTALTNK